MTVIEPSTKKERNFLVRFYYYVFERSIVKDLREIAILVRFEFKRIILTLKFFVALSLILLPATIFLNAIASEYEAFILDHGVQVFQQFSADGYTIIGQFLLQMMALMLVLDAFGKTANDSMKRYFALPVRKINIFAAHYLTVFFGLSITGVLAVLTFDAILWVWTGISLTFVLMLKAFLMTLLGALLATNITLFFVMLAHSFKFSSSIAIIPTLFLFYIIPFLVNFVTAFVFSVPEAYEWTFMYHLTVITKYFLKTGEIETLAFRNSLLIICLITVGIKQIAKAIFLLKEN